MNHYCNFSSNSLKILSKLNKEAYDEENKDVPNNEKLLKLRQQILMKGLEASVEFRINNYNRYM